MEAKKRMGRDLTTGSVPKGLIAYATPLFLSNMLQAVYNMVDMVVVGKYVGNDEVSLDVLAEIQELAEQMACSLQKGDIDGFAKLLNAHWEQSKRLDKGCTNTCIDQIFNSVEDLIDGKMICGAGGGGFVQVVLKKGVTKKQISDRLIDVFADSGVEVYNSEFVY